MSEFFDPTPEEQIVVLINATLVHKVMKLIEFPGHCNAEGAEIPFDTILDRVTASDPSVTDYVIEAPGVCLQCGAEINEKTLVGPA